MRHLPVYCDLVLWTSWVTTATTRVKLTHMELESAPYSIDIFVFLQ